MWIAFFLPMRCFFLIMTAGTWSLSGLLPEPSCILHADPASSFRHGLTGWKQKIDAAPWSWHTGKISCLEMAGLQFGDTCRGLALWQWAESSRIDRQGHLGTELNEAEKESLTEALIPHTSVSWEGSVRHTWPEWDCLKWANSANV